MDNGHRLRLHSDGGVEINPAAVLVRPRSAIRKSSKRPAIVEAPDPSIAVAIGIAISMMRGRSIAGKPSSAPLSSNVQDATSPPQIASSRSTPLSSMGIGKADVKKRPSLLRRLDVVLEGGGGSFCATFRALTHHFNLSD